MKYLNCTGCQALVLVVLAVAAGGVANIARSSNPETFLPWTTDIYASAQSANPEPSESGSDSEGPGGARNPGGAKTTAPTGTDDSTPDVSPSDVSPSDVSTPDPDEPDAAETEEPEAAAEGEFRKIGFEAAVEEFYAGSAFVDARRTKEYVEGHITSAVCISPYEQSVLAEKIVRLSEEVPEEAPVIVYCTASADCEDSTLISRQLRAAGFRNITIYEGGFPEWEAKLRGDERRTELITRGSEPGERNL